MILSSNIGDPNVKTDNSHIVVNIVNQTGVILENLTVQDAYSELPATLTTGRGAGIQALGSHVTLNKVVSRYNFTTARGAGLGLYNSGADIFNSKFYENQSDLGGAIRFNKGLPVTVHPIYSLNIENSEFRQNKARQVGAVSAFQIDNLTVKNTLFDSNEGTQVAGAIGRVLESVRGGLMLVENSRFINNKSGGDYGGIFISDASLNPSLPGINNVVVKNSHFEKNESAGYAGAFGAYGSNLFITVQNSKFDNNHAGDYAGAFAGFVSNEIKIENTHFNNNTAEHFAGALYGEAVTHIRNSKFSGNSAPTGGAVLYGADTDFVPPSPGVLTLENTIFMSNTASISAPHIDLCSEPEIDPGLNTEKTQSFTVIGGQFLKPSVAPVWPCP